MPRGEILGEPGDLRADELTVVSDLSACSIARAARTTEPNVAAESPIYFDGPPSWVDKVVMRRTYEH
jgi:hypothetical protein